MEKETSDAKAFLVECFDVIQVMESLIRKVCKHQGIDKDEMKLAMWNKNRVTD